MNNLINLQRESEGSNDTGGLFNGWNDSRHRSSGVGGKEPQGFFSQKNVGGIPDLVLKAELEKINNQMADSSNISPIEKEQENIQEEDVWDEAWHKFKKTKGYNTKMSKDILLAYIDYLSQHYTLIKK